MDEDESEIEEKYITRILDEAAAYRLKRSTSVQTPAYEAAAEEYDREAHAMLETGLPQPLERSWHWWIHFYLFTSPSRYVRAAWIAQDGFERFPFAHCVGDLLETEIDCYAHTGNIHDLHDALFRLWFFLPDYPDIGRAMETALKAGERVQDFKASVHLEANDPSKVIVISGSTSLSDVNQLFRFLVLHGDRETVAPQAAIGLARSLLRSGDKDDLFQARQEYERFCETYPTSDLVFTALCERALSYLVAYNGADYDVGVLDSASSIIDQAEIESHGNAEDAATVAAYRKRIRSWHQDRDLEVARWYRDRVTPGLSWLMCPGIADGTWLVASRYYYRLVVRQDSGSEQGRAAMLELQELPPPTEAELGIGVPIPLRP